MKNRYEVLRKLLIGDGIAEYFSRETIGMRNDCANISLGYSTFLDRFTDRGYLGNAFLSNAYCLVKPFLDIGIDRGIIYLSTHPPSENQLKQLRSYQENAQNEFRTLLKK